MKYEFTVEQLNKIHSMMSSSSKFNPRDCFKSHHNLQEKTAIQSDDLEDFMRSFQDQYQRIFSKNI